MSNNQRPPINLEYKEEILYILTKYILQDEVINVEIERPAKEVEGNHGAGYRKFEHGKDVYINIHIRTNR